MVVLSINNSSKRYFWAVSIYYLLPVICLAAQLVEVSVSEAGDMERLMQTGLAVMYVTEDQTADVILYTDFERRLLEQSGLRFSVTHENLEEFYLSRMGPARDDIAGYRTFDEICDELNQLHEDFPDIISEPISIGESLEGRPLMAVKISDNPEENEDEPGCVQKDDAVAIFEKMIEADAIVYASPLYCWSFTSQIKPLIDRHFCLVKNDGTSDHQSLISGKPAALLVTCAGPIEGNCDAIQGIFAGLTDYLQFTGKGNFILPFCTTPDAIGDEGAELAGSLAKAITT